MRRLMLRLDALLAPLREGSRALTAAGLLMIAVLLASLAGLWLDPRTIAGAPAWMKPVKFAASTAIYALTLAWALSRLPGWPRLRRRVGGFTAAVLIGEVAIIDLQAWRGTTSHFNVGTPLDAALFSVMGIGILAQTLSTIAVAVALWRQRFADRAMARALRFGIVITIAGAMSGGLMTRPTPAQLDAVRATHRMPVVGAHTVGAPDGLPGLPVTGWSAEHGDLRVAHFVGLHAFQALPLIALTLRRRRAGADTSARLIAVVAASYATLFVLLLAQALRAQSVVAPDGTTLALLGGWAVATAIGVVVAVNPGWRPGQSDNVGPTRAALGRTR